MTATVLLRRPNEFILYGEKMNIFFSALCKADAISECFSAGKADRRGLLYTGSQVLAIGISYNI
jgi:hypothetical protein